MTIDLTDNAPRVSYTVGEGVTQTSFTVPFEFFDDADLKVVVDGTTKTITTHYSVSGGSGATGTVSLSVTGGTGGSTVIIFRDIAFKRTTDFPTSGAFPIATLNTELDRFTALLDDREDRIDRSIKLNDNDDAASMVLPLKASRVGTVLGFNATTGAAEAGPTIANVNALSAITANINTVGGISSNVTTVAGISSNVTTVAGISSAVSSVAGVASLITSDFVSDLNTLATTAIVEDLNILATSDIVSDLNTLATSDIVTDLNTLATADIVSDLNTLATTDIVSDLNTLATSDFVSDLNAVEAIKANVTSVAGVTSNVTTVAGISSNVTTVAGISSNVSTVASAISNVNSVASNISNVNTVATQLTASAPTFTNAVTATGFIIGSANINENDLEAIDGITAGTGAASKAVVLDSSSNVNNIGTISATNLNISNDVDVDGTLEADAITINGTAISSVLSPVAGHASIATVGALNSGSITSGFGNIDNGSSTITTTGALAAGTVSIGGGTIGNYSASADDLLIFSSGNTGMTIASGGNEGSIYFADGTSGIQQYMGQVWFNHSNNTLNLTAMHATSGSASMRLDGQNQKIVMDDSLEISGDLTVNGDTITFSSANSSDPIIKLINTNGDTNGAELHLRKDKGAAGADGDIVGLISFIGDDATQVQHIFAKMEASIATAADGSEGGKLILGVATHDAEFQNGLVLQDGNAEDEIDVTIASGTSSVTTVSGVLIANNNFEVKTGGPSTYDGITDDGAGIVVGSSSASVAGLAIRTGTSGVGSIYFADNSGSADARKAGFIEFQHATDDMIIQAEDDLRLYAKEDVVMRGTTYTFDSEGGASEFMKIDTNGNLGIGTSSPAVPLHVNIGSDNNALYLQSSDQFCNIGLIDGSGSGKIIMDSGKLLFTTGGDSSTSFTNSSTRLTIDTSGNLLVAKGSSNGATTGFEARTTGQVMATMASSTNEAVMYITQDGAGGNNDDDQGLVIVVEGTNAVSGSGNVLRCGSTNATQGALGDILCVKNNGRVGIGTGAPDTILHLESGTGPQLKLECSDASLTSDQLVGMLQWKAIDASGVGATEVAEIAVRSGSSVGGAYYMAFTVSGSANGANFEAGRFTDAGVFCVGNTEAVSTGANNVHGFAVHQTGTTAIQTDDGEDSGPCLLLGRVNHDDGDAIVRFSTNGNSKGNITESGGTVSYNAFMGSHITQAVPSDTLEGSVIETTGVLIDSSDEDYEGFVDQNRLPKCKVSDTEDSPNVFGVWQVEAKTGVQYVSSLGAYFVRVHSGETVSLGDLLSSKGDGTAKVQSDDIIRSKTIGKVTSLTKKTTYSDGSYLLPCVLYCG